jgi:hypothetical protein
MRMVCENCGYLFFTGDSGVTFSTDSFEGHPICPSCNQEVK